MTWIQQYIVNSHGDTQAEKIFDDIDQWYVNQLRLLVYFSWDSRIAVVPLFPRLHQFPQRQGFKQWTRDDSKALMKVSHMVFYPDPLI
jgi:hypothetical protein